jgi:hypothetical protein
VFEKGEGNVLEKIMKETLLELAAVYRRIILAKKG